MKGSNKNVKPLRYLNNHMSAEDIGVLYQINNIKFEKCELFNDFVQSLINTVFDTYLGDEVMGNEDQLNHFNWCWKHNVERFKKEGITLGNKKLNKYFKEFMFDVYYPVSKKDENPLVGENIRKLWAYIFNFTNLKTKADIDTLVEIFKLFEDTLKIIP